MAENYFELAEGVAAVVGEYHKGLVAFDEAFRAAYNAACSYGGDPEIVEQLDDQLGPITICSAEDSRVKWGIALVRGTTKYSPASNFEGQTEADVVVWVPQEVIGDTVKQPLQAGCQPIPRSTLAYALMGEYEDNKRSFGPVYRATYEAIRTSHDPADRKVMLRFATQILGSITLNQPGRVVGSGAQDVVASSRQATLLGESGESRPDVMLRLDPFSLPWATIRDNVISPFDRALSPHADARYDHYAAMQRNGSL